MPNPGKMEFEFPDFEYHAQRDACMILEDFSEEIAEALVEWHAGDRVQAFDLNEVEGSDTWVFEKKCFDALNVWDAVALLEQVSKSEHETDTGQWLDRDNLIGTIESMGVSTYEKMVSHRLSNLVEQIVHESLGGLLSLERAKAIVKNVVDQENPDE